MIEHEYFEAIEKIEKLVHDDRIIESYSYNWKYNKLARFKKAGRNFLTNAEPSKKKIKTTIIFARDVWPKYKEIIEKNNQYSPELISSVSGFLEDLANYIEPQNERFGIASFQIESIKRKSEELKKGEYLSKENLNEAEEIINFLKKQGFFAAGLDEKITELYSKI